MKGEIEKNWDEMARAYEDFTEKDDSYSYAVEWPCIQKMLPPLNNKRILELGCSTGRFSFLFEKENPLSVVGVDISENMLSIAKEKARKRGSKVKFIKADISNPNIFVNRNFDFIFSSTTFHYIENIKSLFLNIFNALDDNNWKQKYISRYNAFIETPSYMILKLSK